MAKQESADIVVVGNGIAGLTAAVEARRLAPDRRIVIITDQSHPTINTPALKQFAMGKLDREQLLAYPAGTERTQRIHIINARVEEINAQGKYVCLSGGRGFGYGSLLLATGSKPTSLPADLPGRTFDGVLTLHRLRDYLDLRRRLSEVHEAVVVGGGAHAIETVMGLLHWGISVHWLIRSTHFMPRILDQPASAMVLERIQRAGANVYTETEVLGIVGRVGAVAGVVTNQQQMIPCQLVLVCTGTSPVTTLAERCTLPMQYKHGILVDDQFRTSVCDIYAAGDVAALRNPQTGAYETRAQWHAAVLQGRSVAEAMTGQSIGPHSIAPMSPQPFGVPWHATQLGDLSMLTIGSPQNWGEGANILTHTNKGSYRRMSIVEDRLVGYLSLGPSQPDSLAIKRIIDEGLPIGEIKKALLKGKFDARTYFSKQRSHAAHDLFTTATGRLPAPHPHTQNIPIGLPLLTSPKSSDWAQANMERDTDPRLPLFTTGPFVVASPAQPPWQPQQANAFPPVAMPSTHEKKQLAPLHLPAHSYAHPSLLTHAAVATSRANRSSTDALPLPAMRTVPIPTPFAEEEEISSFTGSLPNIPKRVVESTLIPLPLPSEIAPRIPSPPASRGSRKLWSYTHEIPVVNAPPQSSSSAASASPSRNLWSYGKHRNG